MCLSTVPLVLMVSTAECDTFIMSVSGGRQLSAHTLIALVTSFGSTLIFSIQHSTSQNPLKLNALTKVMFVYL